MMNVEIPKGVLFYGKTRRRKEVVFNKALRIETEETALKVHELIKSGLTPRPEFSKKCKSCSLVQVCMPKARRKASNYLMMAREE